MAFKNCYANETRAESYAQLGFANTYHLAYRDLPAIIRQHVRGTRALDFGCGTGRSTRFVRTLGFSAVGVDIAGEMLARAREFDPDGDYHLVRNGDLREFEGGAYDLVLSVFTFDNIPGDAKLHLFRTLGRLLKPSGALINVVSSPEIYYHEWASFSTKDYPENRFARPGDIVRIITTDFADRTPAEDVLCPDNTYREIYDRAGLGLVATYKSLATGREPYTWVSETTIAPWVIYVLARQSAGESA